MDPRTFRFSSSFTLEAARKDVHDVLVDLEFYGQWWPQVKAVAKLDDDNALVVCRSTLPYDLELRLTALSRDLDFLEVGIDGPIRGWARFHLHEERPGRTALLFEQEVRAEAPVFVVAAYAAKPVLVWNHHRMMGGAEHGLRDRFETPGGQPRAAIAAS